jgi:hypothetical protein
MAKRLSIIYGSLRQDTHDLPTFVYDPATFNFGYELEIHDRDFVGTAASIGNIAAGGVTIKMQGGRSDMNKAIVPTVASFSILISNQAEEDFLTALTLGDEERFHIKLYHRQQLIFAGYLLIDQITEDITEGVRVLNITAVDGLSRMKDIKYKLGEYNSDAFSISLPFSNPSYPTFIEIINKCMVQSNIPDLYPTNHPLYNVYIDWYESNMDQSDTTRPSVFDQVRCQDKLFYNLDKDDSNYWEINPKTKSRAMSCYNVLETILTLFHAKIFYEDGRYYIRHAFGSEQVNADMRYVSYKSVAASGSDAGSVEYLDNGTTMNREQSIGYEFSDALRLIKPSSVEYIAPHKYVEVAYQTLVETPLNEYLWADNDNTWQNMNYFVEDETIQVHLTINHVAYYNDAQIAFSPLSWRFETQIRMGTWYLQNKDDSSFLCEWVEDSNAVVVHEVEIYTGQTKFSSLINYTTEASPIDGPLEMRFLNATLNRPDLGEVYKKGIFAGVLTNTVDTDHTGTYTSILAGLISQNWNSDEEKLTLYRSGSINGNSKTKSIDILLGNDTDEDYDLSQLYVWQADIGGGDSAFVPFAYTLAGDHVIYNPTQDWGGGNLIQQKLVESYAKTHTITKRIINGILDDTKNRVTYNTVLTWEGYDFLPISLEHITSLDRYKGQFIEIGKSTNSVNVDIVISPTRSSGLVPPEVGSPSQIELAGLLEGAGNSGVGNLLKSRSYTIDNLNYLQILTHTIPSDIKTEYTRSSIDDSYILYVNGVRWRYVPTLLEVDKAGVFTLEPGTLNWNIFRQLDAEIRLELWDRLVVEADTE